MPPFSRLAVIASSLLTSLWVAPFSLYPSTSAARPIERIALQLKGPRCDSQHPNMLAVLSPLPGVRSINLSSIPGHALIDIDTEILAAQTMVEKVQQLWHDESACLVEPMQSCISAGPPTHIGHLSAE
jgi:hypothetical protein